MNKLKTQRVHIVFDTEFSGKSYEQLFAVAATASYYDSKEDKWVDETRVWKFPEMKLDPEASSYKWWMSDPVRKDYYNECHKNPSCNAIEAAYSIRNFVDSYYNLAKEFDAKMILWGDFPELDIGRINSLLSVYGLEPLFAPSSGGVPCKAFNYKTLACMFAQTPPWKSYKNAFEKLGLKISPREQNHDCEKDIVHIMNEVKTVIDLFTNF